MGEKLVRGGFVVTDASKLPDGGLIEQGAVAVDGDRVAAVGGYDELKGRYPQAEEIGSDRHVVIPGLVNTHHHGWGLTSLQLGFIDGYLEAWIPDIWQMKVVDAYLDTLWADMRNIRSGVTTLLHAAYGRDWSNYEGETRAKLRGACRLRHPGWVRRPRARPAHVRLPGRRDVSRVAAGRARGADRGDPRAR